MASDRATFPDNSGYLTAVYPRYCRGEYRHRSGAIQVSAVSVTTAAQAGGVSSWSDGDGLRFPLFPSFGAPTISSIDSSASRGELCAADQDRLRGLILRIICRNGAVCLAKTHLPRLSRGSDCRSGRDAGFYSSVLVSLSHCEVSILPSPSLPLIV